MDQIEDGPSARLDIPLQAVSVRRQAAAMYTELLWKVRLLEGWIERCGCGWEGVGHCGLFFDYCCLGVVGESYFFLSFFIEECQ
jgi:hypothetical protein